MHKFSKIGIGLGVVMMLAVATQPAHAVCSNVRSFDNGGYYIYTPGVDFVYGSGSTNGYQASTVTSSLKGTFWHVGNADPAVGLGNDSGEFAALTYPASPAGGWLYTYPNYPATLQGSWSTGGAQSRIDGCIDSPYSGGTAAQCMAVYLEDVNPDTGESVFALMTAPAGPTANYDFSGFGAVTLAVLPKATIANSVRSEGPPPGVTVTLTSPDASALAPGIFLRTDGDCAGVGAGGGTSLITGYLACSATAPRAQTDPPAPDAFTCGGDVAPLGGNADISVDCAEDSNVWVSYRLVFEQNALGGSLAAQTAAGPSTRIECGPNLAEVPEQRIRPRERPAQPGRQRGR